MISNRNEKYLTSLVYELCKQPTETEWLEFKLNNENPEEIGEYISALSNSAALAEKSNGYLLWGIDNTTHEIMGTSFDPTKKKVGNEELENWLLRLLNPKIDFRFYNIELPEKSVVLLEIERAYKQPVQFKNQEFVRVGSYKKKLKEFPNKERTLWRIFDKTPFEIQIAASDVTADEVFQQLDYSTYFELFSLPLPEGRDGILQALAADDLIVRSDTGQWDITNLGAILFAKRLDSFKSLKRKAIRLIVYKGSGRVQTEKELGGNKGYASGFEGLIQFINSILPSNEEMKKALRKTVPMYPEIAIRELIANALIHQDFSVTGAGPMVEVFDDRMEITNPGNPLVKVERFLDSPPRSRNETLASLMRRIGICEERGSGVDKVVYQTEFFQLPAPIFEVIEKNTRAVLFSHRPLTKMDKADRTRACYLHACLRYVNRDFMTNSSLRDRFGIEQRNSATASRLIKEAVEDGVIRPYDKKAAPKLMKYIPNWA